MDDICPKCRRSLQCEGNFLETIIQYKGLRAQHVMDTPDNGGCGWAWSPDPKAQNLVDEWNARNTDD